MLHRSLRVPLTILSLTLVVVACGESPTVDNEPKLSVAGAYTTAVTLGANTCGTVNYEQHNTNVTHTPGSTTLTLGHAGTVYNGTIQSNATFTTTPKVFPDDVAPLTLTISGSFTLTSMTATVVIAKAGPAPCQYTITWNGPKVGAPNVIP